jgi:DNA-binding transcriptional regulator YiaG
MDQRNSQNEMTDEPVLRERRNKMLSEAILSMMKNPSEEEIKEMEELIAQQVRGITLQKIRESLGVSQDIFGVMLGISEEQVNDLELNGIAADKLQEIQEIFRK